MTSLITKSAKLPVDHGTSQAPVERLFSDNACEFLQVITSYKSSDRRVKAGQDLFRVGEPCDEIHVLVNGWMFRYSLLSDGRRQILDFLLPGAVLAFHSDGELVPTHSVQALTDAEVCIISQKALVRLFRQHPEIGPQLATFISQERNLSFAHLTSIGRRAARARVAHLILELFVRCQLQWPVHGIEQVELPLTQEHIGDATGLTGVHVSRVLGELRNQGVLKFCYRRLSIPDPNRLMDIADIDPVLMEPWIRRGQSLQSLDTWTSRAFCRAA